MGALLLSMIVFAGPLASPASALDRPLRPSNLTVETDGESATLEWTDRSTANRPVDTWSVVLFGETGEDQGRTITRTVRQPTVTVNGLAPGRWEARVRAVNTEGQSARRDLDFFIVAEPEPPSPPTSVTATVDGEDVVVRWQPPRDDGGSDITGYRVVYDGVTTRFGSGRRSATLFDPGPGEHRFAVSVANEDEWSEPVTVSAVIVEKPTRPRNLSATVDGQSINVSWSAPSNDGGGVDRYEVVVGETTRNVTGTSAVFSGLAEGSYEVKVRAVNAAGRSGFATVQGVFVEAEIVVPGPPRSINATTEGRQVTVTWIAPADPGTSPVTSYEVTVDGVTKTVTGTQAVFDRVGRGGQTALVRAISADGKGPIASSNGVSVLRPFDPFNSVDSFVGQQYRDFLGRSPDADGLSFWSNATGARGENVAEVIEQFLRAPEFEHRRSVIRLYLAYFNRFPDADGFEYWSRRLANGTSTLDDVSQFFATSDEFIATYGNLDDGQFVVVVYNNVLVRQPEQAGFVYWLGRMGDGLNRGAVMTNFSESVEFRGLSAPAVDVVTAYRGMLGRTPTSGEVATWVPILAASPDAIESLIATIYTGEDYAARIRP